VYTRNRRMAQKLIPVQLLEHRPVGGVQGPKWALVMELPK
jgi:hypothetical protein